MLVYETETLKDDVTLAGSITVRLFASTTGTDSDFIVKLIDVFPDDDLESNGTSGTYAKGAQQLLIRGDAMRGRYRESYEQPKAFTPDKVEEITFPLQDVFHTFKRNHRIMIHIQSTCSRSLIGIPRPSSRIFSRPGKRLHHGHQPDLPDEGVSELDRGGNTETVRSCPPVRLVYQPGTPGLLLPVRPFPP